MAVNPADYDFSGYATKIGIKCSDGRTIVKDAFKHNDGEKVPLVWQHLHNAPENILGHALLENRDDGVYAYGKFNDTPAGQKSKTLVQHGDISALSIFANDLTQKGKYVVHGSIREVSLVLSGANPEAFIENLTISHGDGLAPDEVSEDEAVIYIGESAITTDVVEHMSSVDGKTMLANELASLTDDQKKRIAERTNWQTENAQMEVIHGMIQLMTNAQRLELYQMVEASVQHDGSTGEALVHAKYAEDATVQDVFNTLDETQKKVVYAIIGEAIGGGDVEHSGEEGESNIMKSNVFDKSTTPADVKNTHTLTHSEIQTIFAEAKKCGSLKDAYLEHAATYGIENIEVLFPDARNVRNQPDMVKREDAWVGPFLAGVYKTPFSRIKSLSADLTEDAARAKGYITGKRKKEEVFPVLKRVTTPTTIYKKQKLDRDDIIDITDFDVVAWLRSEMRSMLNEELARAALIGDGREVDDEDHINHTNIRPVWTDDEIYAPKVKVDNDISTLNLIDEIVRARKLYKGSGSPNFYTTEETITDMLLLKDVNTRRIYTTVSELTSALRVNEIIAVEVMEDQTRVLPNSSEEVELVGILLNPRDYTMGADRGGEVTMFDDFDIDYNQYKYLIETRVSGALTMPKSAVVFEKPVTAAQG